MINIKQLLLIIIIVVVVLWIILPTGNCDTNEYLTVCDGSTCSDAQEVVTQNESNSADTYINKGKVITDKIADQRVESASLLNARCSADCCDKQWPPPFALKNDTDVDTNNIVPSGYMCNNSWNNTGCLCMTKNMNNILKNRGIVS